MSIIAKNTTGSDIVIAGQIIEPSEQYTVQASEMYLWASSDLLVTKVGSGDIVINDGVADLGESDGMDLVKGVFPSAISINEQPAFTAKVASNGMKLFRRVHGVKATLSGDTVISLVVPYNYCKINALEIVWAPVGLRVDLKVYDTPTGTISGTNNLLLNQFGFEAGVAKDYYSEQSQYDADLIKDMKVEVTLKNPSSHTDEVCVNFILHEMKT